MKQENVSDHEALLQEIVRNTEMGKNALAQLMPYAQDREFRARLLKQQKEYRRLNQKAHTALAACGAQSRGQGVMAKTMAKAGIKGRTMMDHSTGALAQMLTEGSNQGVMDVVKARNAYPQASTGAKEMADELLRFQEASAEMYKAYL